MEEVKECEYFNAYKKSSCKGLENPKCKVEDCVLQQLQLKEKMIEKCKKVFKEIKKLKRQEICCCDAVDNNAKIMLIVKQALAELEGENV